LLFFFPEGSVKLVSLPITAIKKKRRLGTQRPFARKQQREVFREKDRKEQDSARIEKEKTVKREGIPKKRRSSSS
jgi:hypothetical protein